jgi:hypothetical protein
VRLALVASVVAFALLAGTSSAIAPGPAVITVTIRQTNFEQSGERTVRTFAVLNRPTYRNAIGTAVLICVRARARLWSCRQLFKFTRGQVASDGLVESFDFYRLAVTGGTGYYDTVGGELVAQRIGSDAWAVVVNLQGF